MSTRRLVVISLAVVFAVMTVELTYFYPGGGSGDAEMMLLSQSLEW